MAEALAIIGAVAAAAQFTEVGSRVVSRVSSIHADWQDRPEFLQKSTEQLEHLLDLSRLTTSRAMEWSRNLQHPAASTSVEVHPCPNPTTSRSASNSSFAWLTCVWK